MRWRLVLLRFLSLSSLAVWLGGFTFYSAVVIPALHEHLGPSEAGVVTQHVTNTLNGFGAAAVVLWWLLAYCDRRGVSTGAQRWRIALSFLTTALLVGLIALHRLMDERLTSVGLRGFYPWHRAYLITSTAQWVVNLGLLWIEAARGRAAA